MFEVGRYSMNIRVSGYSYVVDMDDKKSHVVYRGLSCGCGQEDCGAGLMVVDWVKNGLISKAPDPPLGFTPYLPKVCPVCGGKVTVDHSLSNRTRGIGWRCETGPVHYWQTKWELLKGWFFRDDIFPGIKRQDMSNQPIYFYLKEANK